MAKFGFDVSDVTPDTGATGGSYDPIPDGEYVLKALDAEEKTTSAGQHQQPERESPAHRSPADGGVGYGLR